ncbi:MAG: ferrochelatase [bacterium]
MNRGVLLMAYGSPATLDEVPAYFTHIRGGRPPSEAAVEELRDRYRAIGGTSPLRAMTASQAAKLEAALRARGHGAPVTVGMKHSSPFIADAVRAMADSGIRSATALALAPHYSRISVAGYFSTAAEAAAVHGVALRTVESWHDHPGFIDALAHRLRAAPVQTSHPAIIFTAHSLPQRILSWNDPYPRQLRRTAELVASAAGITRWRFAYQSASHTGEPWLGPDLVETLLGLVREGVEEVVVCPVGFVADHLEVLYDIDVEAQTAAVGLGLRLVRAPSLNDGDDFIAALADLVEQPMRTAPEHV